MSERSARIGLPIPFGWYCVGYGDELAAAQVQPLRYFGEELVLYRTTDGTAALATAFCPHLGAHLGDGRVDARGLHCPFHGWCFGRNGAVVEIHYASKIPPLAARDGCLRHYPVVERNEFLFAWYHPAGAPPSFELAPFEELDSGDWTPCQRRRWEIRTHVQETGENAVDTAHFSVVHNTGGIETTTDVTFDGPRRTSVIRVGHQRVDVAGAITEKDTETVLGAIHSINVGPGQSWSRNFGIDLLMIGLPTPIEVDRLDFRFACSVPRDKAEENAAITDLILANAFEQIEQDIPIWERKRYEARPILCDGDGAIGRYRKWFQQFYADETPTQGGRV